MRITRVVDIQVHDAHTQGTGRGITHKVNTNCADVALQVRIVLHWNTVWEADSDPLQTENQL
jgi:hypothetical protein